MISRARFWFLLRISLIPAGLIILFFSGIFPVEELLSFNPASQLASVTASDVASLTNEQRIKNGLSPLAVSPLLTEAAQDKADDMAAHSYYAHTGPDGKSMLDWLSPVGYSYLNAGENLVIDRTTSEQAVDAWMNSPEHRENILRPQFTEIGIGVAKGKYEGIETIFVVQEFGTPRPTGRAITLPKQTPVSVKPVTQPVPNAKKGIAPKIASLVTAEVPNSTSSPNAEEQGSSTVSYVLGSEFYAPVALSARESQQDDASQTAPKASSVSALSVFVLRVWSFISRLFSGV